MSCWDVGNGRAPTLADGTARCYVDGIPSHPRGVCSVPYAGRGAVAGVEGARHTPQIPAAQATRSRCTELCIAGGDWPNARCSEPTAARRSASPAVDKARKGLKKENPPGALWSKPRNTACGTSRLRRTCGYHYPDRRRAVRRDGSVGSSEPDVPHALGSFRDALLPDAAPGRAKTGRRSVGCLKM